MRTINLALLEKLLRNVNKPGRYIGSEINIIRKDVSQGDKILFGLVYPDLYDLGMANLSLKILYEVLNRMENVSAERAFLPDADMERELTSHKLPIFSLENRVFMNDLDFIGLTIQSELTATNVVHFLHLSHLHPVRAMRKESDPIVIGGGPALSNPEPYSDFFDLFLLGDAEEVLPELVKLYTKLALSAAPDRSRGEVEVREKKKNKNPVDFFSPALRLRSGRAQDKHCADKEQFLRAASKLPGIYVPHHWKKTYIIIDGFRKIVKIENTVNPEQTCVLPATVKDLNNVPFPEKQTVPLLNIPQNRAILEVARGCLNNCRFCQAGYFYRPLRERSPEKVLETAVNIVKSTGYPQMSLLSLSISNYDRLFELIPDLNQALEKEHTNISLPSLRIDAFDPEILKQFSEIKKTGLTFALESMSPSIRSFLNKDLDYDAFLLIIQKIVENNWRSMKIYLMYGFPFEHELEENIRGMNAFSEFVRKLNPRVNVTFHLTPFIPKPGTPLQWLEQIPFDKAKDFLNEVKRSVRGKNTAIKWHSIEMATFEAVMTKADRDFGKHIYEAWQKGAKFDSWDDRFRFDIWSPIIEKYKKSHRLGLDDILPWEHISFGFDKNFFREQYEMAMKSIPTESCKDKGCYACGACGSRKAVNKVFKKTKEITPGIKAPREKADPQAPYHTLEIFYTKLGLIKFLSHLDVLNILEKALNVTGLNIRRSFGFHPHKKIAFHGALALGIESLCEIMTVQVMNEVGAEECKAQFNAWLPEGMKVDKIIIDPVKKVAAEFTHAVYEVELPFPHNMKMLFAKKRDGITALKIISPTRFRITCDMNKNILKIYDIPFTHVKRIVKTGLVGG